MRGSRELIFYAMHTEFTHDPAVVALTKTSLQIGESGKKFSDVIDGLGLQYVDLVQEGGAVLGIALVGYTYILEQAGIRFFSLAGTSAGAINTMLMAGLARIGEPVSEKIIDAVTSVNLFDFVDGNPKIRRLIQRIIEKKGNTALELASKAIRIYLTLKRSLGINPGQAFEKWVTGLLTDEGITTLGQLLERREKLPAGLHFTGKDDNQFAPELAIISSEITTHTKVEFPRMAGLYWKDPLHVPPALFVRASMSIPFFYRPLVVTDLPNAGQTLDPQWDRFAKYSGEVPPLVRFVDGGLLSNFPINVFHRTSNKPPRKPTFGVRLSTYRQDFSRTSTLFGFSGAMISTMRQIYDYDFLLRNPDFSRLICRIDADKKFNWLNFNISREDQIGLFRLGAAKAVEFLQKFDWEEYKTVRQKMNQAMTGDA